jgi:uncharacterized protein
MNFHTMLQEPLYAFCQPLPWEVELFQSKPVRRLKHLAHFGAGALVTSVVHSRYEHTIGVWKLASYFFPDDKLLRAAAILHDIGHLPFSHAVESALNFNHHQLTEKRILGEEITSILAKASIESSAVVELLRKPSVLTGTDDILGIDHLDSFFRDTYMYYNLEVSPMQILSNLVCTEQGIETDMDIGLYLLQLIKKDHELFLSPFLVAADCLLAEAIKLHWNEQPQHADRESFVVLTDADVVAMLTSSSSLEAQRIIETLLYKPDNICIFDQVGEGHQINVRKIYAKVPLCNGSPLTEVSVEAKRIIDGLANLEFTYYVRINP